MKNQIITRNRQNAKTEFAGIPARFRFKINGKFFPYILEAQKLAD